MSPSDAGLSLPSRRPEGNALIIGTGNHAQAFAGSSSLKFARVIVKPPHQIFLACVICAGVTTTCSKGCRPHVRGFESRSPLPLPNLLHVRQKRSEFAQFADGRCAVFAFAQ